MELFNYVKIRVKMRADRVVRPYTKFYKVLNRLQPDNVLNLDIGLFGGRNYYEHIIRNENEYFRICEYIKNNPMNYVKKMNEVDI